jgi:exoribonuclease-2
METEVIEFQDGDALKLGLVLKRSASRIQVTDQNGKQHSLNSRQIMLSHEKKCSPAAFGEFSRAYIESVKNLAEEIDTELLWESLERKGVELNPGLAAKIYFGQSDTITQSAVIRAAGSDDLHFKTKGIHITIRDSQQVEEQKHVQQVKAEKQETIDRFVAWTANILDNGYSPCPESCREFLPFLNSLEQALTNEGYALESWMEELIRHYSGPFRSWAETIVMILVAGDRLSENADPFILESGVPMDFSEDALKEAEEYLPFQPGVDILPVESGPFFSIDDEDTEEIDDAVSVTPSGDLHKVSIHIADASSFISPDSSLEQEAALRSTSIYLPHRQIRMLPEKLSCDLMSLRENRLRPVITCDVLVDREMKIVEWAFSRNFIEVTRKLSYTQADRIIESKDTNPDLPKLKPSLDFLSNFTASLLRSRIAKGALIINRPELKITAKDGEIHLSLIKPDSPSRLIISELMVLYNSLAAAMATENSVPFIYRSQKKPEKDIPELPAEGYDHLASFKLFSVMDPSSTGLEPAPHFGLGLDCYSQVSSPIRRYSDLLNQRQLASFLKNQTFVYSPETLAEAMEGIASAERITRNLERKINRLFTLRYLLKSRKKEFDLVILQNNKGGYLVESIPECFRGILVSAEDLLPGTTVKGNISKIDPETDTLQFY